MIEQADEEINFIEVIAKSDKFFLSFLLTLLSYALTGIYTVSYYLLYGIPIELLDNNWLIFSITGASLFVFTMLCSFLYSHKNRFLSLKSVILVLLIVVLPAEIMALVQFFPSIVCGNLSDYAWFIICCNILMQAVIVYLVILRKLLTISKFKLFLVDMLVIVIILFELFSSVPFIVYFQKAEYFRVVEQNAKNPLILVGTYHDRIICCRFKTKEYLWDWVYGCKIQDAKDVNLEYFNFKSITMIDHAIYSKKLPIPRSFNDALSLLYSSLSNEEISLYMNLDENIASVSGMRNGLWMFKKDMPIYKYFESLGIKNQDDMHSIILVSLNRKLNKKEIDLMGQVKNYVKH